MPAHPALPELLAGDAAARAHVAECAPCRRLLQVMGEQAPAAETAGAGAADLPELPAVDRALFADVRELPGGEGGMGRVLIARDRRLGREVLIKIPRGADPALRRRLEREARLTARLAHPSIVTVYEAGRFAGGEPFYAMPFVRGVPLGQAIASRASSRARLELLSHVIALTEAVAYAHRAGVVHRDIKPDNVLIGPFGETVLIDWGLAKALDEAGEHAGEAEGDDDATAGGLTRLGVGTAAYMPPEQARGAAADPRMDVYALGATLYHLLAGHPPYQGSDAQSARHHLLAGPPPALEQAAPEAPAALRDLAERAMAREPAARFASAEELAAELRRFQTGQLVQSRRYTAAELLRHFARRHRTALRVSAVAAVALAVIATLSLARIVRERDRAEAARRAAERSERRARDELAVAQGVSASRLAAEPARGVEALALAVRAAAPAIERGEPPSPEALQGLHDAIAAVPHSVALSELRAGVTDLEASPDGQRLAVVSEDGRVGIWDTRTGAALASARSQLSRPFYAHFAPDGERLLLCGYDSGAECGRRATGDSYASPPASRPGAPAASSPTAAPSPPPRRW